MNQPEYPMSTADSSVRTTVRKIAVIGNPNTGKSTLFNAMTGLQARVGNYPGVTVEKKIGRLHFENRMVDLIDLPGTYSLSPRTLDEMVSVDVLLGRQSDVGTVDAVVCIVDASNLERNLYLVSQILDLGLPTILVLNMWDVAQSRGVSIDVEGLRQRLCIPVVICEAHRRMGVDDVRRAVVHSDTLVSPQRPKPFPAEFYAECQNLEHLLRELGEKRPPFYFVERLLLDVGGHVEKAVVERFGEKVSIALTDARQRLREVGCKVPMVEARARYAWAREILTGVVSIPKTRVRTRSDRIDSVLTHRFAGLIFFAVLMILVFQALYAWAAPLMELIEAGQELIAGKIALEIPPGPLRSLLIDGALAGVGGVLVFLPQIALLFLFIALLEDCGYMARAAFVMDRLMSRIGLSGKSFVPLMSSFACAIPGVMATRVIENRRDRMVTILVAPLMSCSARLPVYMLLTSVFVPPVSWWNGWITLEAITLFVMSSVGAIVAVPVAFLLKKTLFKGETPPFVMELPSYKWPSWRIVLARVYDRSKAFVARAGTLIFAMTILVWAAGYFPGDHSEQHQLESRSESLSRQLEPLVIRQDLLTQELELLPEEQRSNSSTSQQLTLLKAETEPLQTELDEVSSRQNELAGQLIERSLLGRMGHAVEPAFRPLGWDWKISVGAIASFPAREVIIATLGTIYSLGGDISEDDPGLKEQLVQATHPDGRRVYNLAVACSIMVFFALCAQCASTLAVIRRETNSWRWPAFTFFYMTALAWLGAFATYQIGMLLLR